jgi:hypothetical protein
MVNVDMYTGESFSEHNSHDFRYPYARDKDVTEETEGDTETSS